MGEGNTKTIPNSAIRWERKDYYLERHSCTDAFPLVLRSCGPSHKRTSCPLSTRVRNTPKQRDFACESGPTAFKPRISPLFAAEELDHVDCHRRDMSRLRQSDR